MKNLSATVSCRWWWSGRPDYSCRWRHRPCRLWQRCGQQPGRGTAKAGPAAGDYLGSSISLIMDMEGFIEVRQSPDAQIHLLHCRRRYGSSQYRRQSAVIRLQEQEIPKRQCFTFQGRLAQSSPRGNAQSSHHHHRGSQNCFHHQRQPGRCLLRCGRRSRVRKLEADSSMATCPPRRKHRKPALCEVQLRCCSKNFSSPRWKMNC